MKVQEILRELESRKVRPVYLFHGEEAYYIDILTSWFEKNFLDEASKAFNQIVVYGKDADARMIMDEARQYPMMGSHRLVVVKEAQDMKSLPDLADYISNPAPHSVVVISHKYKKVDQRTKFAKSFDKHGLNFESKKLYDNQLPDWIKVYLTSKGLKIGTGESTLLAEYLGNDLSKISNELDKLILNLGSNATITANEIQEHVGISKEFNIFELQNALGLRDIHKSNLIVDYFAANTKTNPIQVVTTALYSYFVKVGMASQNQMNADGELQKILGLPSPYFVKDYRSAAKNYPVSKIRDIILQLRLTDLKSKGVLNRSVDEGGLMKELIYHILH